MKNALHQKSENCWEKDPCRFLVTLQFKKTNTITDIGIFFDIRKAIITIINQYPLQIETKLLIDFYKVITLVVHELTELEAVSQGWSSTKVFLKISQNSQENICVRVSFLIQLQTSALQLYKKRLSRRCFPVKFAKLLRISSFIEHLW